MKTLTKVNIVFSFFYLMFFGIITLSGVWLMWKKGFRYDQFFTTLICAGLTFIYIIRIISIRRKILLDEMSPEDEWEANQREVS